MRLPQVGEIWASNTRLVSNNSTGTSIIAKVGEETVHLVSLTGVRVPLAVKSFLLSWEIQRTQIPSVQSCCCNDCLNPAFIAFERPSLFEEFIGVVCPLHVPRGVVSWIVNTTQSQFQFLAGRIQTFNARRCKKCNEDATEVLGQLPKNFNGSMWTCQTCGIWWVYTSIPRTQLVDNYHNPVQSIVDSLSLPGYKKLSVDVELSQQDNNFHCDIFVTPKDPMLFTPTSFIPTLYDYVKLNDDF
jgi:hypothetical protein